MPAGRTDFYTGLFQRLQAYGLKDFNDHVELSERSPTGYSSDTHGWVSELYEYVRRHGAQLVDTTDLTGNRLFFGDMRSVGQGQLVSALTTRANYACLFPKRVTFCAGSFSFRPAESWHPDVDKPRDHWRASDDYIAQALSLKPLLLAGIADLVPMKVRYRPAGTWQTWILPSGEHLPPEWDNDWISDWSTWKYRNSRNVISVSEMPNVSAAGNELAVRTGDRQQVLRSPWVRGVDLDTYVEMVVTESESFTLYDLAVKRLLAAQSSGIDSLRAALEELTIATMRLELLFRQKKRSLSFRGATISLGSLLTVGSLVLPADFKVVAAALGGATATNAVTWLRERATLKSEINSSDYWFVWATSSR